jgi:hypothetical protein
MTIFALLGAKALYLLYAWLLSAIIASYISHRKGYGERAGLATGLLLNAIGIVVWLLIPAKEGSHWKVIGPIGRQSDQERDATPDPAPASADTTERT